MQATEEQVERIVEQALEACFSFSAYQEFVHGWRPRAHQLELVRAIEDLVERRLVDEDGKATRCLLVLMPPGSGKSQTVIQACSWIIGRELCQERDPALGQMSYADDLAARNSLAIRRTVEENQRFRLVFGRADGAPLAVPDKTVWGQMSWQLKKISGDTSDPHPTMRAAGFEGGMQGFRLKTGLVIDDPHNPATARALGEREKTWKTYLDVVRTRPEAGAFQICLMTRLAEDDLAGRLMDIGGWRVIRIPALDDNEETYWPPEYNEYGEKTYGYPTEYLLKLRDADERSFSTQYQGLPPKTVGEVFKWWHPVSEPPVQEVARVYQVWDTAETLRHYSTWSVMTEWWKLKSGRLYLANVLRGRWETPILMKVMAKAYGEAVERHGQNVVVRVEGKANGTTIAQQLRGAVNIQPVQTKGQLQDRARFASTYFETGHVLVPHWAPWLEIYKSELMSYPDSRWNDQVSSTCLAMETIYTRGVGPPPTARVTGNWVGAYSGV